MRLRFLVFMIKYGKPTIAAIVIKKGSLDIYPIPIFFGREQSRTSRSSILFTCFLINTIHVQELTHFFCRLELTKNLWYRTVIS